MFGISWPESDSIVAACGMLGYSSAVWLAFGTYFVFFFFVCVCVCVCVCVYCLPQETSRLFHCLSCETTPLLERLADEAILVTQYFATPNDSIPL